MSIIEKLERNERLEYEDAIKLYDLDLFTLASYANRIRTNRHGKKTYFNINRHINPTNICKDVCQFCAYSASRKNPHQYTMTHEEILDIVKNSSKNNIKEEDINIDLIIPIIIKEAKSLYETPKKTSSNKLNI